MAERAPRIVAELGRPETPEETAARKAENSRKHRQRQTLRNLVLALVASLGLMLFIVLIVPRSNTPIERDVDVPAVAEQAQPAFSNELAVPVLPEGWRANAAEIRTSKADQVTAWYVGYLTPGDEYIGMSQAVGANPSWVSTQLARTLPVGTTEIAGVDWTVYDNRTSDADVGNARYGLVAEAGEQTIILIGTASPEEFAELATALAPTITAHGSAGSE
ncbi:DUF4245 domain-containing protein [Agromyces sp. NPDC060279]|uniref:DUF4245 domain-containing protein n=1 Tax=Agromyces sp. NPDC060279 TaxID=3347092 RepID=UPI003651E44A